MRIARELGGRLVGTGDVHYLRREDYDHHTALLCVQTKSTLAGAEADASTPTSSTCATARRWPRPSREWPEAIASTLEIAERCEVELELGKQLIPSYPDPRRRAASASTCARACAEGLRAALRRPAAGARRSSGWRWSSG